MRRAWAGVLQIHGQSSAALLRIDHLQMQTSRQMLGSCCVCLLRLQMFMALAPQMLAPGARTHSRPAQTQLCSSRLLLPWAAPRVALCLRSSGPPATPSCTILATCPMPSPCPSGVPGPQLLHCGSACHRRGRHPLGRTLPALLDLASSGLAGHGSPCSDLGVCPRGPALSCRRSDDSGMERHDSTTSSTFAAVETPRTVALHVLELLGHMTKANSPT